MESWGPSALLDNGYGSTFRQSARASRTPTKEKATKFHLPMPATSSSKESLYSQRGLLASYTQEKSSYGATGYGKALSKPPQRSMDKAEALAYSQASPSQNYPRHVRTTSYEPSPFSAGGRIERHQQSPSLGSIGSWSSSNSSSPLSAGAGLPPRQLTLLASRSGSPRMSPPTSREGSPRQGSPRQLLLGQSSGDDRYYVDPRTPPSPPTAISRLR